MLGFLQLIFGPGWAVQKPKHCLTCSFCIPGKFEGRRRRTKRRSRSTRGRRWRCSAPQRWRRWPGWRRSECWCWLYLHLSLWHSAALWSWKCRLVDQFHPFTEYECRSFLGCITVHIGYMVKLTDYMVNSRSCCLGICMIKVNCQSELDGLEVKV